MARPTAVRRTSTSSLLVVAIGLLSAATALADPIPPELPTPTPAVATPAGNDPAAPAGLACGRFDALVRMSSAHYNNFAYSIAGNGAVVDYGDPKVNDDNAVGRTALRKAAGEALSTASAPGLVPEISNPMRSWSWHAAKLAVVMGVRGDGDTLNGAADELNDAARVTQMACAHAGAQPARGRRN